MNKSLLKKAIKEEEEERNKQPPWPLQLRRLLTFSHITMMKRRMPRSCSEIKMAKMLRVEAVFTVWYVLSLRLAA